MAKLACFATSGAQPFTCCVSRSEPLWYPAVSESPRKTVFEKLPAFFACAAWMGASGFELPLEQPASERLRAVASSMLESGETERVFIFMAADWPLGNVAKLGGVAAGNGFFRRGFVSHSGCCGEPGVLPRLSAAGRTRG